jgi:hypothetical protein
MGFLREDVPFRDGFIIKFMERYPGRLPVILHSKTLSIPHPKVSILRESTLAKFLVDMRASNMFSSLSKNEAVFVFVDGKIHPMSVTIDMLYSRYRSKEDACLHMDVELESTFGNG